MKRLAMSLLLVCAVLTGAAGAQDTSPASAGQEGVVRVGSRDLLTLTHPSGIDSASDRAIRANRGIQNALLDPDCPPEGWRVDASGKDPVIQVCSFNILVVTDDDAAGSGKAPADLAKQWVAELRDAFAVEKRSAFSAELLHRAILGLLIPMAYLGLLFLVRLVSQRLRHLLIGGEDGGAGLKFGRFRVLSSVLERNILAQIITALKWIGYVLLTYLLIVVLLEQFPQTARWAGNLVEPFTELTSRLSGWVIQLLPRIVLVGAILIAVRVLLAATGRVFELVKEGRFRLEPVFSPDTAGPAELTARVLIISAGVLLIGLLVPGESGAVLLGLLGLAGLATALGAWDITSNFLAGMVILYGRPFRRHQRIHVGAYDGTVATKGLFHLKLQTEEGSTVLLPNRKVLNEAVEIVGKQNVVHLRVAVVSSGGMEAAMGLFRHAAAESGLKREEGEVHLELVRDGTMVFHLEWPVPKGESTPACRSEFIQALLARAEGLGLEVKSVRSRTPRES